jgi:hypothetical protein
MATMARVLLMGTAPHRRTVPRKADNADADKRDSGGQHHGDLQHQHLGG